MIRESFRERGPMGRPMPETMGPGFALDLPFTRTPQERAVENLERKRK